MHTIKRIVMVESTNDKVAYNRKKRIDTSPGLENYTVSYVFAIKPVAESLPLSALPRAAAFDERIPLASIEEKLFSRIKAQVELFEPQLLLVYTGFVFKQFVDQYYNVLRRVKEQFPGLLVGRFGVDTGAAKDAPEGIFDRSPEAIRIEAEFFDQILRKGVKQTTQ